ncbi:hypothetical protein DERP_010790 [Dermatophagoides pteronyssinus]|uniref:Uncharacterized protein n=1 Tax=Dermatophagoides pteronyssinus TaxID=6956 RepID=A0ABQ8J6P9_DERPT|nr:hypothetical protein DERP_010790 [Dermatophagoides pteronyssinus]
MFDNFLPIIKMNSFHLFKCLTFTAKSTTHCLSEELAFDDLCCSNFSIISSLVYVLLTANNEEHLPDHQVLYVVDMAFQQLLYEDFQQELIQPTTTGKQRCNNQWTNGKKINNNSKISICFFLYYCRKYNSSICKFASDFDKRIELFNCVKPITHFNNLSIIAFDVLYSNVTYCKFESSLCSRIISINICTSCASLIKSSHFLTKSSRPSLAIGTFYDFVQYVYVWTIDSVIRGLDFQHDGLIHLC